MFWCTLWLNAGLTFWYRITDLAFWLGKRLVTDLPFLKWDANLMSGHWDVGLTLSKRNAGLSLAFYFRNAGLSVAFGTSCTDYLCNVFCLLTTSATPILMISIPVTPQGLKETLSILDWQGLESRTMMRLVSATVLTAGHCASLLRDIGANHVGSMGDCRSL